MGSNEVLFFLILHPLVSRQLLLMGETVLFQGLDLLDLCFLVLVHLELLSLNVIVKLLSLLVIARLVSLEAALGLFKVLLLLGKLCVILLL